MSQELVPYTGNMTATLPLSRGHILPGEVQGVFFTLPTEVYEEWLNNILDVWFVDREEVTVVDYGITDKQGLGYIIIEWDECAVDPLFLDKLRDDEDVQDYTIYTLEVD
jgi:hypothetical protein